MDLSILKKIGLSQGEIKVYNALLEIGNSSTNKIHERTGIERRNIYDILNKLIERGLITYIDENGRRTFQITHPSKILGYLEDKQHNLEEIKSEVSKQLPQILAGFESKKPPISAQVYRGSEGVKAVWEDMLNYKEIYWIGSGNYVPDKFPAFFEQWSKRRVITKTFIYHLFRNEKRNAVPQKRLQSIKFLPPEFSGNPTAISIFGDKVANFLFGENLFVFVIESEELAQNYKKYHKYLWDNVAKD